MPDSLYHQAILEHAKAAIGAGKLEGATAEATVDNPLCGDRVSVALSLDDGTVTAIGHEVRGCVLCQASASLLAQHGVGMTADAIRQAADAFEIMIRDGGPVPENWPELATFEPVKAARSRHECVLLPFEAATRALESRDAGNAPSPNSG